MKTTFLTDYSTINSIVKDSTDSACVLTIGNFDGIHLGHQAMINKTLLTAKKDNLRAVVMVFEPMPKEFFSPSTAPSRLMNSAETINVFNTYHYQEQYIDELIIVDFNENFRAQSANEFVNFLTHRFNVTAMVIGDDFRFGNDRTGDYKFLQASGLAVTTLETVTKMPFMNNHSSSHTEQHTSRVSSTRVRQLLAEGNLSMANELLGRDYFMIGDVQHGDKIGRTLKFPTANISLDRINPPLHGVFAVDVQILDDEGAVIKDAWQDHDSSTAHDQGIQGLQQYSLFGTANVGTRPAVNGKEWRLEVHFPQFKGDLYGKTLKVRFLHYLHGERNYNGLDELKLGIQQDVIDLLAWRDEKIISTS